MYEALSRAATALFMLQAENEKLRADVVRFNDLLASYQNVLVPELRAENENLRERIKDARLEGYAKGLGEMSAELEQVKVERDAAVEQLHGICSACKNYSPYHNKGKCRFYIYEPARDKDAEVNDNWKWCGSKKEE